FLTIALASFGGGLSAWAQRVLVERRRWLDQDEFLSALTLCRLLPGPNQVNMAVYVGTKFRGVPGALAAVAGLVAPPTAILLVLGEIYFRYRQIPALDAARRGRGRRGDDDRDGPEGRDTVAARPRGHGPRAGGVHRRARHALAARAGG